MSHTVTVLHHDGRWHIYVQGLRIDSECGYLTRVEAVEAGEAYVASV